MTPAGWIRFCAQSWTTYGGQVSGISWLAEPDSNAYFWGQVVKVSHIKYVNWEGTTGLSQQSAYPLLIAKLVTLQPLLPPASLSPRDT